MEGGVTMGRIPLSCKQQTLAELEFFRMFALKAFVKPETFGIFETFAAALLFEKFFGRLFGKVCALAKFFESFLGRVAL